MKTKSDHKIATRSEWLATRAELLAEEKQLTRQMDALGYRYEYDAFAPAEHLTNWGDGRGGI